MGMFSKLLSLGAVAGSAIGAYLVAKKYVDNKHARENMIEITPEGDVIHVEAEPSNVIDDVKKAAVDVVTEAKVTVKTNAEKAGIDTDEFSSAMSSAGKAIASASKAVAGTIKDVTPEVVDTVKTTATKVASNVKGKVYTSPDVADELETVVTQEEPQV